MAPFSMPKGAFGMQSLVQGVPGLTMSYPIENVAWMTKFSLHMDDG